MLESQVAKDIDRYLTETLGLRVRRADQGGGRFRRRTVGVGEPDFQGFLPNGRGWAVEVKRPGARARPNEAKQNEVLDWLEAQNVLVIRRATCVDDVRRVLNPATLREHRAPEPPVGYRTSYTPIYQPERDEI